MASSTSADLSSVLTPVQAVSSDAGHDASKIPIHQRLQNVANTFSGEKLPPWQAQVAARLGGGRKVPYPTPRGLPADWPHRHPPPPQFNSPASNPPARQGMPRPNTGNDPWSPHEITVVNSFPNSSYGAQIRVPISTLPQYPPGIPNPPQPGQPPPNYFSSTEQPKSEPQTGYQTTWSSQGTGHVPQDSPRIPHGRSQLPPPPPQHAQLTPGQFPVRHQVPHSQTHQYTSSYTTQPTPFGYQQSTSNQNQPYSRPVFNPFIQPSQNNSPSNQFPPSFPPPFSANLVTYSHTPPPSNIAPTYSVNTSQQPHFAPREQIPGSNPSMVSSTVGGSELTGTVDVKSKWSSETYSKTQEVHLPPDWKKAYDGEGRAYFYHVVTRLVIFTQLIA